MAYTIHKSTFKFVEKFQFSKEQLWVNRFTSNNRVVVFSLLDFKNMLNLCQKKNKFWEKRTRFFAGMSSFHIIEEIVDWFRVVVTAISFWHVSDFVSPKSSLGALKIVRINS